MFPGESDWSYVFHAYKCAIVFDITRTALWLLDVKAVVQHVGQNGVIRQSHVLKRLVVLLSSGHKYQCPGFKVTQISQNMCALRIMHYWCTSSRWMELNLDTNCSVPLIAHHSTSPPLPLLYTMRTPNQRGKNLGKHQENVFCAVRLHSL